MEIGSASRKVSNPCSPSPYFFYREFVMGDNNEKDKQKTQT